MEWADDITNRPRRANAGNRLQELLQNGLDEDDEQDLRLLDNSSSDTSFTLGSDEETIDEVESDFDAEEVGGTLEGEAVETEATVRRAERQERKRELQKKLQRSQHFSKVAAHDRATLNRKKKLKQQQQKRHKRARENRRDLSFAVSSAGSSAAASSSSDNDDDTSDYGQEEEEEAMDLRQRVRRRPPPTIPCAQRLAEAQARAAAHRAAQATLAKGAGGDDKNGTDGDAPLSTSAAVTMLHSHRGPNMGRARPRPRRNTGPRNVTMEGIAGGASGQLVRAAQPMPVFVSPRIALYDGLPQRIVYCSGESVLKKYKVPTVLSFSESLPPVFQS